MLQEIGPTTTYSNSFENKVLQYEKEGYTRMLDKYNLLYKKTGYHLQVGEITKVQGWIIHISVVRWQVDEMLNIILPLLKSYHIPFKILKDKETVRSILDGGNGQSQVGKVISIYPEENGLANSLAKDLIKLTASFKAPAVLTDAYLGGTVYTRYGSFFPIVIMDQYGKEERHIYDSSGNLIKDIYTIPFTMPKGVDWPFKDITVAPQPHNIQSVLSTKYKPVSTIKTDAKGNVIKALYIKRWYSISWCIIKQGKRNMWSDEAGRDITERLKWQYYLHKDLEGLVPLPRILDIFEDQVKASPKSVSIKFEN